MLPRLLNLSYQDAVEELVHEEPQDTGHDVAHVVEELHIHDHGLVATDEGASVAHEAHHEHDLVGQLGTARNRRVLRAFCRTLDIWNICTKQPL